MLDGKCGIIGDVCPFFRGDTRLQKWKQCQRNWPIEWNRWHFHFPLWQRQREFTIVTSVSIFPFSPFPYLNCCICSTSLNDTIGNKKNISFWPFHLLPQRPNFFPFLPQSNQIDYIHSIDFDFTKIEKNLRQIKRSRATFSNSII